MRDFEIYIISALNELLQNDFTHFEIIDNEMTDGDFYSAVGNLMMI